eukprot:TRINITY_DN50385_c0_g1_i1.p1 TRINITY_DN50385_c0_g1~~TRINITY_DN50385_c0_g1_i1.p1  ORF type:complete len:454 (+),score=92.49 TRINITY_DN50385_c0_g1_i1:106-1362(+)
MACVAKYPLPDDSDCLRNEDCAGGFCVGNDVGGRCHRRERHVLGSGQLCRANWQCVTDKCRSYLCSDLGDLRVNDTCLDDQECSSGNCRGGLCRGGETGAACLSPDECASHLCREGICIAGGSDVEEPCLVHADCGGGAICLHGRCETLAVDACQEDADCSSGRCVHGKCHLEAALGSFCLFDKDCASDMCIAGECRNHSNLSLGATCTEDKHCASGHCVGLQCADKEAAIIQIGRFCVEDAECESGHCVEHQCQNSSVLANGKLCMLDEECASGHCIGAQCHERGSHVLLSGSICFEDLECTSGCCNEHECTRHPSHLRDADASTGDRRASHTSAFFLVFSVACAAAAFAYAALYGVPAQRHPRSHHRPRGDSLEGHARSVSFVQGAGVRAAKTPSPEVGSDEDDEAAEARGLLLDS